MLRRSDITPPIKGKYFGKQAGRFRRRFLGQRIGQKIFLSYVLPLAISIVAGLVLPFVLWSYLGRAGADYAARVRFVESVKALRQAGADTQTQARSFVLYRDDAFRQQYLGARENYRVIYREVFDFVDKRQNRRLEQALQTASLNHRNWLRLEVNRAVRSAEVAALQKDRSPIGRERAERIARTFTTVDATFAKLIDTAEAYRRRQEAVARVTDVIRRVTAIALPIGAILLALLIGRSIALGVTRPLEELRRLTDQVEQGNPDALALAEQETLSLGMDGANDEIGDLQTSFRRMARTITQREAVLRTQNEALGGLNRRIEALLNATNDGILMLDRVGGFSLVNQRLAYLFGLEAEMLLDHTFSQAGSLLLSRFRKKAEVRARLNELLNDPEAIFEETFDIAEPMPRTLRIYSAPVRGEGDGEAPRELLGRIFVFRDVTRETTVDRMKTEFVSTVSHELRTPLTAIKGYVDLLVSGQTGEMNPVQTEFLTLVQQSTRRLTTLINDMLDISRIESGRVEIRQEFVDYVPLVQQTVRMMSREAEARRIRLEVAVLPENAPHLPLVSGDADRITQVLINLISNSIKYTPMEGEVKLSVEFENDFVTTCVSDNGIGISAEDQKRLFQKFFRADNSTTRDVGGTGLGLAITKAILEKLNGSIWVESELGEGSRFYFTLPTAQNEARVGGGTSPRDSGSSGEVPAAGTRLALSIDGDVGALHRLGHELRRVGFVTANAATLTEALRRARDLRPDIITLDILSPGIDGFAVLRALRSDLSTRAYPVVLLALNLMDGRSEARDNCAFLSRDQIPAQLSSLLAKGLDPLPQIERLLVLVISDTEDLAEQVRRGLPVLENRAIHFVSAFSPEQANQLIGDLFPNLLVLDTNVASGRDLGEWVYQVKRRRPAARMPIILITDEPALEDGVVPLPAFGEASLPLSSLPLLLADQVARHKSLHSPQEVVSSVPLTGAKKG